MKNSLESTILVIICAIGALVVSLGHAQLPVGTVRKTVETDASGTVLNTNLNFSNSVTMSSLTASNIYVKTFTAQVIAVATNLVLGTDMGGAQHKGTNFAKGTAIGDLTTFEQMTNAIATNSTPLPSNIGFTPTNQTWTGTNIYTHAIVVTNTPSSSFFSCGPLLYTIPTNATLMVYTTNNYNNVISSPFSAGFMVVGVTNAAQTEGEAAIALWSHKSNGVMSKGHIREYADNLRFGGNGVDVLTIGTLAPYTIGTACGNVNIGFGITIGSSGTGYGYYNYDACTFTNTATVGPGTWTFNGLVAATNTLAVGDTTVRADEFGSTPQFYVAGKWRLGNNGATYSFMCHTNLVSDAPSILGNSSFSTNFVWDDAYTNSFIMGNASIITPGIIIRYGCTNNGNLTVNYLNTSSASIDPPSEMLRVISITP